MFTPGSFHRLTSFEPCGRHPVRYPVDFYRLVDVHPNLAQQRMRAFAMAREVVIWIA